MPLVTVKLSSVPPGVTNGTAPFVTFGVIDFTAPDVIDPMIAFTLSLLIKFDATVAASTLSDLLSFEITLICLPLIPPALLISSAARSAPFLPALP